MKKDKLESFIQENRNEFDFHIPEKNVWSNIRSGKRIALKGKLKFIHILSRIAAVMLIFGASYAFHEYMDIRQENFTNNRDSEFYNLKPEIKEAEYYYSNQVNLKLSELQPFLTKFPGLESEVMMDMSELDSIYSSLKKDLKDNIDNEQVLEAMIQNYRMKLKILEDLLLDVTPNKTHEKHEKHNI